MSALARFPVTPAQIDRVVQVFYARIRAHPDLGPIFAAHIHDWPAHEEKIARFWRNAILLEGSYDGNPMRTHMAAGNVRSDHFPAWLAEFDAVLRAELSPDLAAAWSALAHRIGQGLSFGLDHYGRGVPNLAS
jgi:hemoglobin